MRGQTAPDAVADAKLVAGAELHVLTPGVLFPGGEPGATSQYWAVELTSATGSLVAQGPGARGTFAWEVYAVDARTGDLGTLFAGPETTAPRWSSMVDHASSCDAARRPAPP